MKFYEVIKNKSIAALFILLVLILAINPRLIHNIYSTIIGRIILLCLIIYFSLNNTTLGLISALIIIIASNQFSSFTEGMENNVRTIGDDNQSSGEGKPLLTKEAKKKLEEDVGFDKEDIKVAISPKDSKAIPVNNNMNSSEDVSASSSGMLNNSKLEGFSSYAPVF